MSYEQRRADERRQDAELAQAMSQLDSPMPVTPEWQVVLALLRGGWPGSPTDSDELAFRTFLSDLDPGDVARALRDLARGGARYRPTPAEVRVAVVGLDTETAPTFDEAWRMIVEAGRANAWQERATVDELMAMNRAVGSWAQMKGVRRLGHLPADDPEHGRWVLRDLAASWQSFQDAWAVPSRREALAAPPRNGGPQRITAGAAGLAPSEQVALALSQGENGAQEAAERHQ
jgi:hypothetical protein